MPLPQPCPDLAALDLLVSVGELGSISAAATAHGVTQPAASMRLKALETVLHLRLLERSPSGARLTPEGAATAEWAAVVLRDVRSLLTGTAALRARRGSQLRLAASLTVAEYLIPAWLQRFARDQPGVEVSLEMGNSSVVADLVGAGAVDLGFIEGPNRPGRLRSRELVADELVVVVGPGHPWTRRRRPVEPAELATTPLVVRERGSGTRDVLAAALAEHDLVVRPLMELGSTTAIKAAAMAGTGPAVVSALTVVSELAAGQLMSISTRDLRLGRAIRAVWRGARPPSEAAARLVAIAALPTTPPA